MFLFAFLKLDDLNFHKIFNRYRIILTGTDDIETKLLKKMFDACENVYLLFSFSFLQPIPIWNMSEPQYVLKIFISFWQIWT